MTKVIRVAEIGAGYGRLAYLITKLFPNVEYNIFDISPALAVSQNYLACVLGEHRVSTFREIPQLASNSEIRAFLPHQIELFPDNYFDLVINVSSFDEMAAAQVDHYFSELDKKCGGWLYLQGHAKSQSQGVRLGVNEFPYRNGWTEIARRDHPFIGSFVERIYKL
jgi:putative sugar O-methyltransferase